MLHQDARDHKVHAESDDKSLTDASESQVSEHEKRTGPDLLPDRTWLHESGYGGKVGKPRTSSDQREGSEREGDA